MRLDLDYEDMKSGFAVGKAAAIADWQFRKEQNDGDFKHLVWRLQAKKYWAAKPSERKARIFGYRRRWALEHPEQVKASAAKARKKLRGDPRKRAKELADKRARHAEKSQARRAATVYTCAVCEVQWCQLGRIPARPPKYCVQACRSRANYLRAKAAGKR